MPTSIRKSHSSASLTEMRREIFHAVGWQVQVRTGVWSPPTDVYDTENDYVVRVEIAGMREEDFEITVENNFLSITGARPDIPERRAYHQMEIRFGKFESVVGLPGPIELDAARAEYKEGFLTITLPKNPPKDKG
ncbi:MAG: Hsp20/alpha crystallin family protein [Chloroflexota bacterium]